MECCLDINAGLERANERQRPALKIIIIACSTVNKQLDNYTEKDLKSTLVKISEKEIKALTKKVHDHHKTV